MKPPPLPLLAVMFLLLSLLFCSWSLVVVGAFKSYTSFWPKTSPQLLTHTFKGLRREGTSVGSREGAWVMAEYSDGTFYHVHFDRGHMISGSTHVSRSYVEQRHDLLLSSVYEPWNPMSPSDIYETTGLELNY